MGTYGSRTLSVGGEAIARAADKVQDKAKQIAAHLLEAAPEDIELADGKYQVRGPPDKGMSLGRHRAGGLHARRTCRRAWSPGWRRRRSTTRRTSSGPFGAHAAIVDVDADTGKVKLVRYVAVDDCGKAINPMLIDGPGARRHRPRRSARRCTSRWSTTRTGQLVTGTFVDYALPTAAELPSFETDRTETPSPVNSLGVKGVGEAGTIAASPDDRQRRDRRAAAARRDYIDMPLTPMRVWQAIQAAKEKEVRRDPG